MYRQSRPNFLQAKLDTEYLQRKLVDDIHWSAVRGRINRLRAISLR